MGVVDDVVTDASEESSPDFAESPSSGHDVIGVHFVGELAYSTAHFGVVQSHELPRDLQQQKLLMVIQHDNSEGFISKQSSIRVKLTLSKYICLMTHYRFKVINLCFDVWKICFVKTIYLSTLHIN